MNSGSPPAGGFRLSGRERRLHGLLRSPDNGAGRADGGCRFARTSRGSCLSPARRPPTPGGSCTSSDSEQPEMSCERPGTGGRCWARLAAERGLPFVCVQTLKPRGTCLLYTSDAADDLLCVDLGGRRIIKKK